MVLLAYTLSRIECRCSSCCGGCFAPHHCLSHLDFQVTDRNVENLSGGELQRFAIAVVAAQQADVYMIDEPSSYLDVRQRLKAAQVSSEYLWLFSSLTP